MNARELAYSAINRWRHSFFEANGHHAPSVMYCGHGWYAIEPYHSKVRAKKFHDMADVLDERIAKSKKP